MLQQRYDCVVVDNALAYQHADYAMPYANAYQQPQQYQQKQQQQLPFRQKYKTEYEQEETEEPQRNTRYGNNGVSGTKQLQQSGNRYGDPQQLNRRNMRLGNARANAPLAERSQHKCRIWVPIESFEKYAWASSIQIDQSNKLQLIEICCTGFGPIRWMGNTKCQPICENCQNGRCLSPGKCQCYEEFVSNDNGDCVFTCPLGCLNGRCYLDGSCQCDAGYKLDETRKFCRPICSAGCGLNPNHNCTEPEVCGCAKGFQLSDQGCRPLCQPDCGIGGYCRDNNVCECEAGYTLKDGVCQSDCYQKCDNGVCYGRNRCICNSGFSYHERSTQCIPV